MAIIVKFTILIQMILTHQEHFLNSLNFETFGSVTKYKCKQHFHNGSFL